MCVGWRRPLGDRYAAHSATYKTRWCKTSTTLFLTTSNLTPLSGSADIGVKIMWYFLPADLPASCFLAPTNPCNTAGQLLLLLPLPLLLPQKHTLNVDLKEWPCFNGNTNPMPFIWAFLLYAILSLTPGLQQCCPTPTELWINGGPRHHLPPPHDWFILICLSFF